MLTDNIKDFTEFTLTKSDIKLAFGLFTFILTIIGIFARMVFARDRKKMSWVISLCNSFVLSIIGIIYLFVKVPLYKDFFLFGIDNGLTVFHSIDNVSFLTCLWFGLANIFDLSFGLMFYFEHLDPLTAFVHHIVYIWIMLMSSTGNGIFMSATTFAPAFVFVAVEEIPTFLLALGSIFPSYRTDIGFGITFFILRLAYHFYMLIYSFVLGTENVVITLYTLTGVLHIFWFSTWLSKYGKNLLKNNVNKMKKKDIHESNLNKIKTR